MLFVEESRSSKAGQVLPLEGKWSGLLDVVEVIATSYRVDRHSLITQSSQADSISKTEPTLTFGSRSRERGRHEGVLRKCSKIAST